jgi:DNA-binding SARP family transcriptional activator
MLCAMDFRVLGPVEVVSEGYSLDLGGRRRRGLLALLLLHAPEALSAERLTEELWGDEAGGISAKTLHAHVSRLRTALGAAGDAAGAGRIATTTGGYRIVLEPGELDLRRFRECCAEGRRALAQGRAERAVEQLGAALAEWRGPALCDLAYEPFAQAQATRLEEERLAALEDRFEAALVLGRHAEVVGELGSLVAAEPLRERPRGQLMLALYRCGRQSEALEVFRAGAALLDEELGLRPAPELVRLEAAILRQDPALDLAAPATPVTAPVAEVPLAGALRGDGEPPFVGRSDELATLRAAWDAAAAGHLRAVLLVGEPGIGKTRLAGELAHHVTEDGGLVLYGRCDETLAAPGRPVVELLRAYTDGCPDELLHDLLGPLRGDLLPLLPELRERLPGLTASPAADPETERVRVLDAVVSVLRQAGEQAPVLVVLDDLQWADELTLLTVRRLLAQDAPRRILLVATLRDTEATQAGLLDDLLADAARHPAWERCDLAGLAVGDVAALAGREGAGSLAEDVHAATAGNPFFAGELLRAHVEAGGGPRLRPLAVPRGVLGLLRTRLARMAPGARDVLQTAALLGREVELAALLAVTGDRDATLDGVDRGARARLLQPVPGVPGRLAFTHALVVQALAEDLDAGRAMRLHERIALTLVSRRAPPTELAWHFVEAAPLGHAEDARRWACAAGDEAMAGLAFGLAAEHYERARRAHDLVPAADRVEGIAIDVARGRALRLDGDPRARGILLSAAREAEAVGETELAAEALLGMSLMYATEVGEDAELVDLLRVALERLPEDDGPVRAGLLAFLALEGLYAFDHAERERLATEALAVARRAAEPVALARALIAREWTAMHPDGIAERLELADEVLAVAREHGLAYPRAMGQLFRFMALLERGELPAAASALAAARSVRAGAAARWVTEFYAASHTLLLGRLQEAEEQALAAVERGREAGLPDSLLLAGTRGQLGAIRLLQGRLGEIEQPLRELSDAQPQMPAWHALLARLEADAGDAEAAARRADAALRSPLLRTSRDQQWSTVMVLLADVYSALGDRAAAALVLARLRPYSGLVTWNTACSLGPFDLAIGRLEHMLGRPEDAERHLRAAVELCERMDAQAYLAIARHELAAVLLRARRHSGLAQRLAAGAADAAARLGVALPQSEPVTTSTRSPSGSRR